MKRPESCWSGTSKLLKRLKRFVLQFLAVLVLSLGGCFYWASSQLKPLDASGKSRYIRFEEGSSLIAALNRLEQGKVLKNAWVAKLYARLKKVPSSVRAGTYELGPNQSVGEILDGLQKPVRRLVRIPETNWSARTANLLEKDQVGSSSDYMALVNAPSTFQSSVDFPLPKSSLEGYLYPDTYDLPPLMSSKSTIRRQLANFQKRVWEGLGKPKNLQRVIIIASMVEMEVARDSERPVVAGVIENRLAKGMPLQIDAAINYGIQKWRPLTYDDYKNVDSPYNLYRHKGLPPGPICSPSIKSIQAALNPAKHPYLYYVALPSGRSLFAATYAEHLKNVAKRRNAIAKGTPE